MRYIHEQNERFFKNHISISVDAFDKIQHLFMIKLNEPGIEGNYLNIIKAICENFVTNSILNVEKPRAFPLKLLSLSPLLVNTDWKFQPEQLARKKNKRHPHWKGRSKNISLQMI